MSECGAHTENIPSHPIDVYHPYTREYYSQYNNIPSHPIDVYHPYTREYYSQYNNNYLKEEILINNVGVE